jgi:hypothetical protein
MKTRVFAPTLIALLAVFLLAGTSFLPAQQPVPPAPRNLSAATTSPATPAQQKVFVFVQRTDRHAKYSKPEVFHDALTDILDYLAAKNVVIAVDEFGGRNHAEGATPIDTIFDIARDAKANSVLYFVVDRPPTKWIKITAECFDISGKSLWQEEASSGGGLSGAHGLEVTSKKLHAELDKRIGQEGVPVLISAQVPATQK